MVFTPLILNGKPTPPDVTMRRVTNNLAYVNNRASIAWDWLGCLTESIADSVDTTIMAETAWDVKFLSGKKNQDYTIKVDFYISGNSLKINHTLEQTGASWNSDIFLFTSLATITYSQLVGNPTITYTTENGVKYKNISQTYEVRVLTTLTRSGKAPVVTSSSKLYSLKLSSKIKE